MRFLASEVQVMSDAVRVSGENMRNVLAGIDVVVRTPPPQLNLCETFFATV
ncbi:hypothetical protein V1291_005024 [Nitrobacteraceae bacterium AZCC 1564]